MGKQFFNDWALWQKMTFVLGCGIVATLFVGFAKLQYDRYRIRKYTKVEKGKQRQTPEMLEAQPIPVSEDQKDEIPFGIRAIESGLEVEGVWISRSNTPVGSSRSSMTDIKLSQNGSQLELPKAAYGSSSRNSSSSTIGRTSTFDRAVDAERIPTNESRSSSPGRENPSSYRGRNPSSLRNSTTLQALEGQDPASSSVRYSQVGQMSSAASGQSRSSDESDYMTLPEGRPYEAAYINPKQTSLSVPNDPKTDLDLLQSHRMSHVAETGQLTPRVRRPGNSGEWASVADHRTPAANEISTANGVEYFVPRQKTPSPPLCEVAVPPQDLPLPSATSYYPTAHASNQAKQAIPLLETQDMNHLPQTYQPRGPQFEYDEEEPRQEVVTAQNGQRQSQVLRKVNSGFEILRPGTLGEPTSPEEDRSTAGSEKRKSKRLQKRRTSSSASRTSHFVEQV